MQRIADWLEKLGMPEYAQRFAQNGINIEVLCYLADQDLKDIGVLPGHRRIMRVPCANSLAQLSRRPFPRDRLMARDGAVSSSVHLSGRL
jgi:hypothetical protein